MVRAGTGRPPALPARSFHDAHADCLGCITDFFNDVSRYPTAAQKAELLAVVTSMKGCEGYTLQKLTAYFSRMRIERKQPVAFVKAESPDSLSNAGELTPSFVAPRPAHIAGQRQETFFLLY